MDAGAAHSRAMEYYHRGIAQAAAAAVRRDISAASIGCVSLARALTGIAEHGSADLDDIRPLRDQLTEARQLVADLETILAAVAPALREAA